MASITLNNLWNFIQSMSLSANNELWLAEKLHESALKKQQANKAYNIEEAISRVQDAEKEYSLNGRGTTLNEFTAELKDEQLW